MVSRLVFSYSARARRQRKCRTLPNSDDRSVPGPQQRCASESKRLLCQCCGISDLLSMTPYLALARSAPAPAPSLRAGEADVSIDRLSSIVGPEPESANNNFAKKKWRRRQQPQRRPGGSSRSVCLRAPGESARLARARDGSERWRTLPNSDDRSVRGPQQRCASESKRLLCQCCGISDLLSMSPYLALARSAPAPAPSLQAGEADVSIDRLSSIVGPEPESAKNNSAKKKMATSPAAAAPTRRLEQVGLPQSPGNWRALRARVTAAKMANAAKFR